MFQQLRILSLSLISTWLALLENGTPFGANHVQVWNGFFWLPINSYALEVLSTKTLSCDIFIKSLRIFSTCVDMGAS